MEAKHKKTIIILLIIIAALIGGIVLLAMYPQGATDSYRVLWNIMQWVLTGFIIYLVIAVYIPWRNKRLQGEDKMSDEEAREIMNKKYPAYYPWLKFLLLILPIVVTVALPFIVARPLGDLKSYFTDDYNAVMTVSSEVSSALVIITMLVLFIFLGAVIRGWILSKMPEFYVYYKHRDSVKLGSRERYSLDKSRRIYELGAVILTIVLGLFIFLSCDDYTHFYVDHISHNSFFTFTEERYSYDDIDKVEFRCHLRQDDNGAAKLYGPNYIVKIADGPSMNIWNSSGMAEVHDIIKDHNPEYDTEQLTAATLDKLESRYPAEKVDMLKKISTNQYINR